MHISVFVFVEINTYSSEKYSRFKVKVKTSLK